MVYGTYCRRCVDSNSLLKIIYDDCKLPFNNVQVFSSTMVGRMSNVAFVEEDLIHLLSPPTNYILKIGCNYGEITHRGYIAPLLLPENNHPNAPMHKHPRLQNYFGNQITFEIQHPDTGGTTEIPLHVYKIILFRNGVFQVSNVKDINMMDLVKPIEILCDYLSHNMNKDVQVISQEIVMHSRHIHE